VSAVFFLSHILIPLLAVVAQPFDPLLKYCRTITITDGLSFGQQWVHLGGNWHWLCWTWGMLLAASPVTIPPPLHYHTLAMQIQYNQLITLSDEYKRQETGSSGSTNLIQVESEK